MRKAGSPSGAEVPRRIFKLIRNSRDLTRFLVVLFLLIAAFPSIILAQPTMLSESGVISPEQQFEIPEGTIWLGCCGAGPVCSPCIACPPILEMVGGLPCPDICYNGPSAPIPACDALCEAIIAAMMAACEASIGGGSFGYGGLVIGCSKAGEKIVGCEPIHTPCYPIYCQDCFACTVTGLCGVKVTCAGEDDATPTPNPTPSPTPTEPPPALTPTPTPIGPSGIPTALPIFLRE